MSRFNPKTVANAARALFATGHSEALVFFFLKAAGANCESWISVTSSSLPPEALRLLAEQPEGFDELVVGNIERFGQSSDEGLPTRPGTRGSDKDYTMYFPIAEEAQYLLRKKDCNRNAIWSNLRGGRNALNSDRADQTEIFETAAHTDDSPGMALRLRPEYVYAAFWYFGPKKGIPMRVPLAPLAVWIHRTTDFDTEPDIDSLIEKTKTALHLTGEELALIFDRDYPFAIDASHFTERWSLSDYFKALCLPASVMPPTPVTISPEDMMMDKEKWGFIATAIGTRQAHSPLCSVTSEGLIESGERNLLLLGPPRTGKSHDALKLAASYLSTDVESLHEDERFTRVQFHQAWTYGDFIRKLVPGESQGQLTFTRQEGAFLRHCRTNPSKSVFIIDELNRANVAEVFGEAFQVFEVGYRGSSIELSGAGENRAAETLTIPRELLLICTANNLDRATFPLDFALLGRFATVDYSVRYDVAYQTLVAHGEWGEETARRFVLLLREINSISGYPVGHAVAFIVDSPASVISWYVSKLRPALALYLTDYRENDLQRIDQLLNIWSEE
jgi:MoxR-like ATPase